MLYWSQDKNNESSSWMVFLLRVNKNVLCKQCIKKINSIIPHDEGVLLFVLFFFPLSHNINLIWKDHLQGKTSSFSTTYSAELYSWT